MSARKRTTAKHETCKPEDRPRGIIYETDRAARLVQPTEAPADRARREVCEAIMWGGKSAHLARHGMCDPTADALALACLSRSVRLVGDEATARMVGEACTSDMLVKVVRTTEGFTRRQVKQGDSRGIDGEEAEELAPTVACNLRGMVGKAAEIAAAKPRRSAAPTPAPAAPSAPAAPAAPKAAKSAKSAKEAKEAAPKAANAPKAAPAPAAIAAAQAPAPEATEAPKTAEAAETVAGRTTAEALAMIAARGLVALVSRGGNIWCDAPAESTDAEALGLKWSAKRGQWWCKPADACEDREASRCKPADFRRAREEREAHKAA